MRKQELENWMNMEDESLIEGEVSEDSLPEMAPEYTAASSNGTDSKTPGASESTDSLGTGLSDLWKPEDVREHHSDLATKLEGLRLITAAQATQAKKLLKQAGGKSIATILIEMGIDECVVVEHVAALSGLEFERVDSESVHTKYLHRLGNEFCKGNGIVPIRECGIRLVLGVTDPHRLFMLDEVRRIVNRPIKVVLVTAGDVKTAIEAYSEEGQSDISVDEIIKGIDEDDVEVVETKEEEMDLEQQAAESPVIRFVNFLISDAVKNGASDIHVEPQEKKLRIRYRIDGILFEMMNPPHGMHAAIVSRLKIMANLDISERRLPQDGRIRAMVQGRKLDLRLSTLPTGQGEKAVMRILDSRSVQITLDQLGMPQDLLQMWRHQIGEPHGIILVTGPTGSGKTTTLYSSLNQMDRNRLNISTVEDPIEYHLGGISQVQTHERIGMTFAAALKSLLRQDPDVVMVGEIRDDETARIAVQASLTGHLVLSTLHTNDAPSAITRLINIGVEPFLISAAVNGVLAQRLVRRICEHCKELANLDEQTQEHLMLHGLSVDQVYSGKGCEKCHSTGYSGRIGLYELLVLDDTTRDMIVARPNVTEFRRVCIERGMNTLRSAGFKKVLEGSTTVEEVLRVTQSTV